MNSQFQAQNGLLTKDYLIGRIVTNTQRPRKFHLSSKKTVFQEAAENRSRAAESPAEFSQWLQGMQAEVTRERAAAKKKATDKK